MILPARFPDLGEITAKRGFLKRAIWDHCSGETGKQKLPVMGNSQFPNWLARKGC